MELIEPRPAIRVYRPGGRPRRAQNPDRSIIAHLLKGDMITWGLWTYSYEQEVSDKGRFVVFDDTTDLLEIDMSIAPDEHVTLIQNWLLTRFASRGMLNDVAMQLARGARIRLIQWNKALIPSEEPVAS